MVSKSRALYEISLEAFEREGERSLRLEGKEERIASLVAAAIGFEVVVFSGGLQGGAQVLLSLGSFSFLALALIVAARSSRVRAYKGFPRGTALSDAFPKAADADDYFLSVGNVLDRAREESACINDGRAKEVNLATGFLVGGLVFLVAVGIAKMFGDAG